MNTNKPISEIMTSMVVSIGPNTIMTEIAEIFESNSFHHLPVLDGEGCAVGVISSHDYFKLQHNLSKIDSERSEMFNTKLFRSLIAEEIMTKDPVCLAPSNTLSDAIDIFLKNQVHSILIANNAKCIGIVTPYDILKEIHSEDLLKKLVDN